MNISIPVDLGSLSEYALGIAEMDSAHGEFLSLCASIQNATPEQFSVLFKELAEHTHGHFANENRLMQESGFPPTPIHMGEHQRVLGMIDRLVAQVERGDTAPASAWLNGPAMEWFTQHLRTMDSALAFHLDRVGHPVARG